MLGATLLLGGLAAASCCLGRGCLDSRWLSKALLLAAVLARWLHSTLLVPAGLWLVDGLLPAAEEGAKALVRGFLALAVRAADALASALLSLSEGGRELNRRRAAGLQKPKAWTQWWAHARCLGWEGGRVRLGERGLRCCLSLERPAAGVADGTRAPLHTSPEACRGNFNALLETEMMAELSAEQGSSGGGGRGTDGAAPWHPCGRRVRAGKNQQQEQQEQHSPHAAVPAGGRPLRSIAEEQVEQREEGEEEQPALSASEEAEAARARAVRQAYVARWFRLAGASGRLHCPPGTGALGAGFGTDSSASFETVATSTFTFTTVSRREVVAASQRRLRQATRVGLTFVLRSGDALFG